MQITIKKGLDIPIRGRPEQTIHDAQEVTSVAITATDVNNLRASMLVSIGYHVRLGQTLFTSKRYPDIRLTSPGAGDVTAINRGARRALQSVVIRLQGDDAEEFEAFRPDQLRTITSEQVRRLTEAR